MTAMNLPLAATVPCPKCLAPAGKPCTRLVTLSRRIPVSEVHPARFVAYKRGWAAEVKASQERLALIARERANVERTELRKQLREEWKMSNG